MSLPSSLSSPSATHDTCYACPVCQQPLHQQTNGLQCDKLHRFDRHKKSYVNLLLSQHKQSKNPGDNSDMVLGRRAFLRAGHYQPFANAIIALAQLAVEAENKHCHVVDAGCGEGFYTTQLQQAWLHSPDIRVYGFDISKPAIQAAAQNKHIQWSVASSHRPPFMNESIGLITSIFSPVNSQTFSRILKPKGHILYAGSGDQHLHRLRSIIYNTVNAYSTEKHKDYFSDDLELVKEMSMQVPIHLTDHDSIMQLINMTPHTHRIPKDGYARLLKTQQLDDMGDFRLYLYRKK